MDKGSLTLPSMQRAKPSVVPAAGQQSETYRQDKAAAMRLAIEDSDITPTEFPAFSLRGIAVWILAEPNASEMPTLKRSSLEDMVMMGRMGAERVELCASRP
jgi:hypothetical protein